MGKKRDYGGSEGQTAHSFRHADVHDIELKGMLGHVAASVLVDHTERRAGDLVVGAVGHQ